MNHNNDLNDNNKSVESKKSNNFWGIISILSIIFLVWLFFNGNKEKSTTKLSSDEERCVTCYKAFKKADGWCYDVGGIGTQNCSGGKYFCSFYCASKRGKENTPKSWQRQYNN